VLLPALFACSDPEPVIRAVEPTEKVAAAQAKREAEALHASPKAIDVGYRKADGVYVDAHYLGGRSWSAVRAEVEKQLGAVIEERTTAEGDREVRLERGTVRLDGDRIMLVDVTLPEPARRSEALAQLGFPPNATEYVSSTLDFRLENAWGFRRLVFVRAARGSEDVVRVQCWKFTPAGR
jgi:hypothetical protein